MACLLGLGTIRLLDSTHDSITLIWNSESCRGPYELQMRVIEEIDGALVEGEFMTLSATLSRNVARKNNLQADKQYEFRVRISEGNQGSQNGFSDILAARVLGSEVLQMDAPICAGVDAISATLQWTEVVGAEGYNIRYRADDDLEWELVDALIRGTSVRKKGLQKGKDYFFSVVPVGTTDVYAFSSPSIPIRVLETSHIITDMFPEELLSPKGKVKTSEVLAGKAVAIYFSGYKAFKN